VNIDRTKFKIKFGEIDDEAMRRINTLYPETSIEFDSDLSSEERKNLGQIYRLKLEKNFEFREWDIGCQYLNGYGIRDLKVNMLNQTARRILAGSKPKDKGKIHFAPGPKSDKIPSMPAWNNGVRYFTRSLALIFKLMLYFIVIFIIVDLFLRWMKETSFKNFRLLRFSAFYFGMTSLIIFSVNYRPAVSEAYKGYFTGVNSGYFYMD